MRKFKVQHPKRERTGRKFEKKMAYTDVPAPCTNAKFSRKYASQNSDVARCSMKKDVVVKSVRETLHGEPTPVKSPSILAY